jgi:UDP-glucose:(heptosyl)LPS alpha-1,3-glucosyltransferase
MTAALRIALVRQRYNPYGGAERIIARALPALERAGAQVTLIARRAEGWGARRIVRADPFYVGNLWRDWSFSRAASRAWRREAFDIVQSHERIPGCHLYRAGDGVHRRWLERRIAASGFLERLKVYLNPYHHYVLAAERRMFEHPRLRAVVCNSRMVRDEVLAAFRIAPEKLHVIYNGVDLEHFSPAQAKALRDATRAALGYAPQDTVFAFVGSGFARKGLGAGIAALARAGNTSFHLLVVGRDRHAARFEAQARAAGVAERVRFVGGQGDVRPYYAAADCLVLASRYDPFPNTVLEALAMGRPAIVSDASGTAELIEHGRNGWLCRPDDVEAISRLMLEAAGASRGGPMGAAARATAERYGIDAMAGRLNELYASLAASPA